MIASSVRAGLQRVRVGVTQLLRVLAGELHWTPPPWSRQASQRRRQLMQAMRSRPRLSAAIAASTLTIMLGALAAWHWYTHRPQPEMTQAQVEPPRRTCYECEPAGRPNALRIRFDHSAAPLKDSGKTLATNSDSIRLQPAVAGSWRWQDDSTLEFTPAADWPIGATFKVTLARHGLFAPQILLQQYQLQFDTAAFAPGIESIEFYQDPVLASDKSVVATLSFSHPVDPASLESRLSLHLYSEVAYGIERALRPDPAFTLTYDRLRLHAYVHSARLAVAAKQGRVQLEAAAGIRAQRGGAASGSALKASVDVPGQYSLKIEDARLSVVRDEDDTPSLALMIQTSASVTEAQMRQSVHAWLLPLQHPDPGRAAVDPNRPYHWNADEVTPAVRERSTPIALSYVPNEREHVELHGFALKVDPHRRIYLQIDGGLSSFGGYVLADPFASVLEAPEYPREAHIVHSGSLLALSGQRKLTLFSRGTPAVRVRIARLLPHQLQHLVTQTRGDFSHPRFEWSGLTEADLTERFTKILNTAGTRSEGDYQTLDLSDYLASHGAGRQGIFLLRVEAFDPARQRPTDEDDDALDTRLLVVTDLGLLAKESSDGSRDVFVQSIVSGEPVANVRIDVLGRNGQVVLSERSDASGHVHFPDLVSFKDEREPVLFLAQRGADSSFLPISSHVQPLDLSRFDVGGVSDALESAAMSAYLFSDRGTYRPGDEIRAAVIVKRADWQALPAGLPLDLEITDPRGVAVLHNHISLSAAGFDAIRYQTRSSAAVGSYTVSLYLSGPGHHDLLGSLSVKLQEFLPDRLRMRTHFSSEAAQGWVSPEQLQAQVTLENLFGTPATERRVRGSLTLSPALASFAQYPDYHFRDPQSAQHSFSETLTDQKTDSAGHAHFDLNLGRFERATYRVQLLLEGAEADGGRAVSTENTQLVSSLPYLIGWKADGALDFVLHHSQRDIAWIAVDHTLARTAAKDLTLKHLQRRYVSVLMRQNNGTYKYESHLKEIDLGSRPFELGASGTHQLLDSSSPGDFSELLTDAAGQVYARVDYTVAGSANLARSLDKNAELQIVLNKHDYAPGETIQMQIQAPYTGAGLITIERDHVYSWQWFKASTTSSMQSVRVPDGIEGNAYVSVSFVRDPTSDQIYTAPLSYGVQPFSIALDQRRNHIELTLPERVRPGDELTIGYRTDKPARIALFAVDEGILQVARYRAPDPLSYFFQKRALRVSTRQILDLILPEYRAGMLSAPGGDDSGALAANLNPFKRKTDKPVALWSGIVDAGSGRQTLRWTVPDYFNGTLRVMAVAVNDDSIGTADSTLQVRGDFVLSPNAPLTVTPNDQFEVSVGVANNVVGSGADAQVSVSLRSSPHFQLLTPATVVMPIGEMREGVARFRLRTHDVLGSAQLQFSAVLGPSHATLSSGLSVRPAVAYMSTLTAARFHGSVEVPVSRTLYPQFRTLQAAVSHLPLVLAHGLVAYLGHYPYSCTEQLVSQAMPAIVLSHRADFGEVRSIDHSSLESLIEELRARQNTNGSYRYWAGGVKTVPFVSAYAQQVLLEAAERGQPVPADLMLSGNQYLKALARRDADSLAQERTGAFALYLLARQGTVVSNEAAALQQRLEQRYPKQWHHDIAAAYLAAAYGLMQQRELAQRLIGEVSFGGADDVDDPWHSPLSRDATLLYLLSRHFPERLTRVPAAALDSMVEHVRSGDYDSLSAATAILALDAYADAAAQSDRTPLSITASLTDKSRAPLALSGEVFPQADFPASAKLLDFGSDSRLDAYYVMTQAGFDRSAPTQPITDGLEVMREYLDAQGRPVDHVHVGDELTVHLRFRSIGRSSIDDAVLVDLLPGGFDLVIPSTPAPENRYHAVSIRAGAAARASDEDFVGGCVCSFLLTRPQSFPDFADLREDRVVLYGRATDHIQEFSYRVRATNAGDYAVPSAYGESMYDSHVRARSLPRRIVVERL